MVLSVFFPLPDTLQRAFRGRPPEWVGFVVGLGPLTNFAHALSKNGGYEGGFASGLEEVGPSVSKWLVGIEVMADGVGGILDGITSLRRDLPGIRQAVGELIKEAVAAVDKAAQLSEKGVKQIIR